MKTLFILAATTSLIAPLLESFAKANNIHCERIAKLDAETTQRVKSLNGFVVDAENTQLPHNLLNTERTLYSQYSGNSRVINLYAPTIAASVSRKLITSISHAIDAASKTESKVLTIVKDSSAGWDQLLHSIMTSESTKTLLSEKNVSVEKAYIHELTDASTWPETMFTSNTALGFMNTYAQLPMNNLATTTGYITEYGALLLSNSSGLVSGIANYCELDATEAITEAVQSNIQTAIESGNDYLTKLYQLNAEVYSNLWKMPATASA